MKTILFIIAALPSIALATAQTGDILIYKGEPASIFSTPLESYFVTQSPPSDPRPNARPQWLTMTSTACLRGYVAKWELREKRLYLKKIEREEFDEKKKSYVQVDITNRIFPEEKPPIEATWFTGTIRMPQGPPLRHVHLGFESISEKDVFLEFEGGILKRETVVDNTYRLTPTPGFNP